LQLYLEDNDCYCSVLTNELLVYPISGIKSISRFSMCYFNLKQKELAIKVYSNRTTNSIQVEIRSDVDYSILSPLYFSCVIP
jgi:hypothetical protein